MEHRRVASPDNRVNSIRRRYGELLQGDMLEATRSILEGARDDPGLAYTGPDAARILRPGLVSEADYARAGELGSAVVQALEVVYLAATRDGALRRDLGVPQWQDALIALEVETLAVVGRLDGLVNESGNLHFIEFNPTPGGTYEMHALGRLVERTPVHQQLAREFDIFAPDPMQAAIATVVANHAERGLDGLPRIAVFGWNESPNIGEIEQLAGALRAQGITVQPVAAEDRWSLQDDRTLLADGLPFDLVLFLDPAYLAGFFTKFGLAHPMLEGLRVGAAQFFGGLFRTLFLSSKRVFAALSDPALRYLIPAKLQQAVDACIPWTRIVKPGKTTYEDAEVSLLPFIAANRERLVLKPALGYGGQGVVLGWMATGEDWQNTLAKANAGAWVVQERVVSTREAYPVWRDGRVSLEELWWDLNPYVWRGREAEGCLVRVGSHPLLNTSAGTGSTAALFVVR